MTVDEFKALYPDFSQSYVDEQIGSKLRLANLLIDRIGNFDDARHDAIGLLIAHMLTLDKMAGKNGTAIQSKTSKKVGDVQFNYAQEDVDRSWYNLSNYGQQLLWLIDLLPNYRYGGGFVV